MKKLISIVVPAFDEEKNIPLLHAEVSKVVQPLDDRYNFEFIFVNDGSRDNTWNAIRDIAQKDTRVRGLSFSRNFGNQYALEAGISKAEGDAVILMDCDLEHPPELLLVLLARWAEGYDVVNTQRASYCERSWFKKKTSSAFYSFFNLVSEIPINHSASDYLLMDRRVVKVLKRIDEGERFYRGLIEWLGFNTITVEFDAGKRLHGESGYSLKKLIALAWTSLTSFSTVPMKAIILFGGTMTGVATTLLVIMSIVRWGFQSEYFTQLAFLVVAIIATNGITLVALGIIAMYILRIHKEVQGRPNYVVHKTVNTTIE